jgi:two-component system, LytTR family, sensor kinase
MNKNLLKQFFTIAALTAPIIASLLVTPFFLVSRIPADNFPILVSAVSFFVFFAWLIHIALLRYVPKSWEHKWIRIAVGSAIMLTLGILLFEIVQPDIPNIPQQIQFIRLVNVVSINLIILVISDLILLRENKNQVELENSQLKLANMEAHYLLLKEQINPHFIFNALSTAKSLIRQNPELAEDYIVYLSDFLRASLNNQHKTIALSEELQFGKDYISLQIMRFGKALQYACRLDNLDNKLKLPYFSIITLLENAIKHNSFTDEMPLRIEINEVDGFIEVKNNLQKKFVIGKSTQTGLKNLHERYELLTGTGIVIEKTDTYFAVRIKLIQE